MAGCCPPGSLPELVANHEDQGTEVEVPGLDMKLYVVGEGDTVILHFYDIFGSKGGRNRFNCDQLAKEGYKVVVVDLFRGDSCIGKPMTPDVLMPWIKQFPREKVVSDTEKVIAFLQSQGAKRFGATGTCWGSWAIFHCCAKGLPIEAGVNYHPSLKLEDMYGRSAEELSKLVKQPQLLLPAGNDPDNIKPGGEVIKILEGNGVDVQCKEYPNQVHGYMSRADLSDPAAVKDVEDATKMAYEFLAKYFK